MAKNNKKTSTAYGYGIAGFVLGIVGLVAWLLPIAGLLIAIVGLIFAIKGLPSSARNQAVVGIVLAVVGLSASLVNATLGVVRHNDLKEAQTISGQTNSTDSYSSLAVTTADNLPENRVDGILYKADKLWGAQQYSYPDDFKHQMMARCLPTPAEQSALSKDDQEYYCACVLKTLENNYSYEEYLQLDATQASMPSGRVVQELDEIGTTCAA